MVETGAEPVFNSHFLYGGVFVNNTTENIKKEGPSVFDRRDQADSIPFYRGQVMKEGLLIKVYDKSGQVDSLSSHYKHRL